MKPVYSFFLTFFLFSTNLAGQAIEPPCTLKARVGFGVCIDIFCIPVYGYATEGTPPYQYEWFNGSTASQTSLNYGTDPTGLDTCLTLVVRDAAGCIAIASGRYIYAYSGPYIPLPDSNFLKKDTLSLSAGGGNFDVGGNDSPLAQDYLLVQPPKHGAVSLNADGTGTYTPEPGWCGPDYFRYTATDTTGCTYAQMATAFIRQTPCAGILSEKADCNHACDGAATFFQNGVLTPPLSYIWSDGSTSATVAQLCAGAVAVTVTDAIGAVQVYNATIAAENLQADITGPTAICNGSYITLGAAITSSSGADYHYYWSGPDIYGQYQFDSLPTPYCSSTTSTAIYQIRVQTENGCRTTDTLTIGIQPALWVDMLIAQPKCPGDTLAINLKITKPGTPPYHYAWSGPAGVQSNWSKLIWPNTNADHSGFYSVTVTDVNGCTSIEKNQIVIPATCNYAVIIYNKNTVYCTGTDFQLQYGMTPNWVLPDQIEWTGPNGFTSNQLYPTLQNVNASNTGWYHVQYRLGNYTTTDSAFFTVAPTTLSFISADITPPTHCFAPFDGKTTLAMSAAPPYQVKYSDTGSFQNVSTNPIVRSNVSDGDLTIYVKKDGCIATKTFHVAAPDPPQIVVQDETCAGNDGSITLSAAHPLQVNWILPNGDYLNNTVNLAGVAPGTYKLFVKDLTTNCQFRDTIVLKPYLQFQFAVLDTPTCTVPDGTLLVIPSGTTTPPISYLWNNGFQGNPAMGLAEGGYSVTLTDGDGCSQHQNTVLTPEEACIAQVSGRVYANLTCACVADNATVAFPFAKICATNGSQTTCSYASNTGEYNLALTEPGTYTITATTYLPNPQGACTEHTFVVGADITRDTTGLDFYFCGTPETDLQVTAYCGTARPGFNYFSSVQVRNNGFWSADTSTLVVQLSPYIISPIFSPQPADYNPGAHTATWIIPKLVLYQQYSVEIRGTIMASLGDTLTLHAEVQTLQPTDTYLSNNTSTCSTFVTGSYDPNDKTVNPPGMRETGSISPLDSVLTYTIRFQNTGTDTAFTVVVRDTLDAGVFDLNTIRPLFASHPFQLDLENGNILVFTFPAINLPDSNRTEPGSKGFLMFSIQIKNDLPNGSNIANNAAIYFDYNEPIITNTTLNTLVTVHVSEPAFLGIALMPNPTSGQTLLSLDGLPGTQWLNVVLLGIDGTVKRQVYHTNAAPQHLNLPIETSGLPPGIYLVAAQSNLGQATRKLVVIGE